MKTINEKSRSGKRKSSIPNPPKMMQNIGPLTQPGLGVLNKAITPSKASNRNRKASSKQAKVPSVKNIGNR